MADRPRAIVRPQPDVEPFAAHLARFWGSSQTACAALEGDSLAPLESLRRQLEHAPIALVSAPAAGGGFEEKLGTAGLRTQFLGLTATSDHGFAKETLLAVVESPAGPVPTRTTAPTGFRAVALMPTFNEEDIVEGSILALAADRIDTYVIDNWSTDATPAIVERLLGSGVIGMERFPAAPTQYYEWKPILRRMEELSLELDADWFLHVDADERPTSPWPGVSLHDALSFVDRCGFSAVDHTTLTFQPVDDAFRAGDPERHFRFYEFGQDWGDFHRVKSWKNLGVPVRRADSGGHDTHFEGRRVYPFKFLLKHYPIRSQAHGERKVYRDRVERWSAREREAGWHVHYDGLGPAHRFVRDAADLLEFEEESFNREFLVERLSGIGVPRLAAVAPGTRAQLAP